MNKPATTSKAFKDYDALIDNIDLEAATEVELDALVEEMAACDEIDNFEYCLLAAKLGDKFRGWI